MIENRTDLTTRVGMVPAESIVEVEADALDGAPQCPSSRVVPFNACGSSVVRGIEPVTSQPPRSDAPAGAGASSQLSTADHEQFSGHRKTIRPEHPAAPVGGHQFPPDERATAPVREDEAGSDVAGVMVHSTQRSGTRLSSTQCTTAASTAPASLDSKEGRLGLGCTGAGDIAPVLSKRITEEALRKGAWRSQILRAARPLLSQGYTLSDVAPLVGTSVATLCRLRQDYASLTDEELTPENLSGDTGNCGRPSPWKDFAALPDVRRRLQELYLLSCGASSDYMTRGRRTGSAAATLLVFSRDPLCPEDLRKELSAGKQPAPLLSAIREINDLIEQRYRGPKHSSLNGTLTMRRSLVEILQDGQTVPIQAGDWWVFDDMSDNMPHFWEGAEGLPFIGRQGLYGYDITGCWLGVEKVGTVRDSYTAAIILRFLRRLMAARGKPRRGVIFERSVWESNAIKGCRISTSGELFDEEIERPGMEPEQKALLQQGLEALGIIVYYTYTPRGKEIEGAFNYLQRLKPMVASAAAPAASGAAQGAQAINIGRHAGEFEHAAKQLRRVRARSHHPADLGFLHIDASADLDEQVMSLINEERGFTSYPELGTLTDRDLAVFLPRRHDLEIRNGKVTATIAGQPFDFCAPELFASLGSGYRVSIKFDESEPTLGAAVYNDETGSGNFRGWQKGEFIGMAEFLAPVGRFDWTASSEADLQADIKKRFNGHVRTAFRAVGMKHARAATVRDGRGNVAATSSPSAGGRALTATAAPTAPNRKVAVLGNPSPDQWKKQQERLKRQAEQANQLRALTNG